MNVGSEIIVTTEDKMRLYLMGWREQFETRGSWIAPLSLFLTLAFTFLTSTFHDAFGLSASFWQSVAFFCTLASAVWLTSVLVELRRSKDDSIGHVISLMKESMASAETKTATIAPCEKR